jgi:hypothetical protein
MTNDGNKQTNKQTNKHTQTNGVKQPGHEADQSLPYNNNSVALAHERTIPTERPPLVGEVSANFLRKEGVAWSARRIPTAVNNAEINTGAKLPFAHAPSWH